MLQKIENFIFNGPVTKGIHFLEQPDYTKATGLRKKVLMQLQQEFQRVPPITLHYANEKLMASVWAFARESLVAGKSSRVNRELVAAITSQLNKCPFCIEVHTSMLHGAGDDDAADIAFNENSTSSHQKPLADWARATLTPKARILAKPPFDDADKPYLIATVLVFHYTNRMVTIFLDESPLPIGVSNKWLKNKLNRMVGFVAGRRIVSVQAEHGEAVYYHNDAKLDSAFSWAKSNKAIAKGLATFANAIEEAGAESLSPKARKVIIKTVDSWNGESMPMSRNWIESTLEILPNVEKTGAELALLVALADYRIDEKLITRFKENHNDTDLVNVTAWGAFIAMKRVSTWITG